AFSPISCSKETFDTGRKLCAALSCSLRKYFSTAWRISSDSATASDSLSIRNHVLPPDASQTYLMLPPTWLPAGAGVARAGYDLRTRKIRSRGASQQQPGRYPSTGGKPATSLDNRGCRRLTPCARAVLGCRPRAALVAAA